jgi:hypothetical protein
MLSLYGHPLVPLDDFRGLCDSEKGRFGEMLISLFLCSRGASVLRTEDCTPGYDLLVDFRDGNPVERWEVKCLKRINHKNYTQYKVDTKNLNFDQLCIFNPWGEIADWGVVFVIPVKDVMKSGFVQFNQEKAERYRVL